MHLFRFKKFSRRKLYFITTFIIFFLIVYLPYNFNIDQLKILKPFYFLLLNEKEILNGLNYKYLSEPIYKKEFQDFLSLHSQIKIKDDRNSSFTNYKNNEKKTQCPFVPPNLSGQVEVDENEITFEILNKKYENIFKNSAGGHWKPQNCQANFKVAIIVPYRDRDVHLKLFLNHMHKILPNQLIDYSIYIIEQTKDVKFNRGLLMNIGFVESLKDYDWDCFIFHDVDLVPLDDRNLYYCSTFPRHMSVAVNTFNYK
jgi:hypothetical protein